MRIKSFGFKNNIYSPKVDISRLSIELLIGYCILFPADKINVKEILLLVALFFCFLENRNNLKISRFIFLYAVVVPLFNVLYALARGNSISNILSYGYVWIYLLLVPTIVNKKIDIMSTFLTTTYIVALVIDFIFLSDILGIFSIYTNPVALFFKNMNELQGLGKGVLATFGYSIFYKSCPLILISYAYLIYKKKYIWSIPLLMSLFACGTRANFLMALFISVAIPVLCTDNITKKMLIILIIVVAAIYLIPVITDKLVALNTLKYGRSEAIKSSDMNIIISLLKDNVFNFLFGTGVGSTFDSIRGGKMTTFELSYVDYLRQTGIMGITMLAVFLVKPIKVLYDKQRWLLIGFISYLAVAFTNPLLVNSTSFMLYLLVYNGYFSALKNDNLVTV